MEEYASILQGSPRRGLNFQAKGCVYEMAAFMNIRREKLYLPRRTCRPGTYRSMYRFDEEHVEWMSQHFLEESGETRGGRLNAKLQMEVFLRYLADPGFQSGVAEDKGIQQSTVSKTFSKVLPQVVAKAGLWIKFPETHQEIRQAQRLWQEKNEIPGSVGALDCTHVKTLKPGGKRGWRRIYQ